MASNDTDKEENKNYNSDEESAKAYPKGRRSGHITPKMLIKALKRLSKSSFKRLLFTANEVGFEILRLYPEVEHDCQGLLLEVSDKLECAAAAGLVGTKQDLGYYAYELPYRETDARSELMFWIFYKRVLKRRAEQKISADNMELLVSPRNRKKTVRLLPLTGNNLHIIPLMRCRQFSGKP